VAARVVLAGLELVADEVPGPLSSPGAGNGVPDAGERLSLAVRLRSLSEERYLSLSGTLSAEDGSLTTVPADGARRAFAELDAGGESGTEEPFVVELSERLADRSVVRLILALEDSRAGEVETLVLRIGVRQGVALSLGAVFVDDDDLGQSDGDGDGRIEVGEDVELQLDLANSGTAALPLSELPGDLDTPAFEPGWVGFRLSCLAAWATPVEAEEPFRYVDPLAAGANAEAVAELELAVAENAPDGAWACLAFEVVLGAGERELYRFVQPHCFHLGEALGPACVPQPEECNGVDDDCNSLVDDQLLVNACGECGPLPEEICNGVDDDCDDATDEELVAPDDACPPPEGVCEGLEAVCRGEDGWSCDLPGSYEDPEQSCDGLDNDCDGRTDEAANPPAGVCPEGGVCDDADAVCDGQGGWRCELPDSHENTERTCDGLDNDCDGRTDEGLSAPPGVCPSDRGVCAASEPACDGAQGWQCDHPATWEQSEESCDGLDNDCDGATDRDLEPPDGLRCLTRGVCAGSEPLCQAEDGWSCSYPASFEEDETLCDGLDNDCDGRVDEDLPLNRCGFCGPVPAEGCAGSCDSPLVLPIGELVSNDTGEGVDRQNTGCGGRGLTEAVYAVDVPEESLLHVVLGRDDFSAAVELRSVCDDPASRITCVDTFEPEVLQRVEPGRYYVIVEGSYGDQGGSFSLEASLYPAEPPPDNDTCAGAAPLAPGEVVVANNLYATNLLRGRCMGSSGPELVWELDIPERSEVTVSAEAPGFQVYPNLRTVCDDEQTELGCRYEGFGGVVEAGLYYLVVEVPWQYNVGDMTVSYELSPADEPTPRTCAGAQPLELGVPVTARSDLGGFDFDVECAMGHYPDLVYRLDLQGETAVRFEVTPAGRWDPVLQLRTVCDDPDSALACEVHDQPIERVLGAGTYWVVVDARFDWGGEFTLLVEEQ